MNGAEFVCSSKCLFVFKKMIEYKTVETEKEKEAIPWGT